MNFDNFEEAEAGPFEEAEARMHCSFWKIWPILIKPSRFFVSIIHNHFMINVFYQILGSRNLNSKTFNTMTS